MKKIVWLACLLGWQGICATSYTGTDLISADGITITAGTTTTVQVPIPVRGAIDGNETGTLSLSSNLFLDASCSFTNGIVIDGQGNTLHLFGNHTLPAAKTIEVSSSLTIDGHNNIVNLNGASFYCNGGAGTTLRLKNMTLVGLRGSGANPSIYFGATAGRKLILENVTIYLADDYTFTGGALDIYGNVALIGDYNFNYNASHDCTIKTASTLQLGMHVTFNYQPTDNSPNHFKFTDLTSTLFLYGGFLYAPSTIGLKMLKGHLVVDHLSWLVQDWSSPHFGSGPGRIALGDGTNQSNNMAIDILPGAQLATNGAAVDYGIVDAA